MTPGTAALLAGAGLLAGGVNAVAGGGSLISFPALLAAGYPPVTANVTNTVALLPGNAGSVAGGLPELTGQRGRLLLLGVTGAVGAVGGAVLLLTTPSGVFDAVVPYLILLACGLLLAQPRLAARVKRRRTGTRAADRSPVLLLSVLLAGVYGAYFGAGLGVMLLGVLGIALAEKLSRVNALKNVLSTVVNGVAVLAFGIFGPIAWEAVAVIAVASLAGGYAGGRLARRIPSAVLRAGVVAYGVVVAAVLIAQP